MARRPRDVEIIEVLHPDDPSWSWDGASAATASSTHEPRAPRARRHVRWWMIAAPVALVMAVAAVVAVSHDEPAASATLPGRFLVRDAPALHPSWATEHVAEPPVGAYRMWVDDGQPGAAWLSVEVVPADATVDRAVPDATLHEIDGLRVAQGVTDPESFTAFRRIHGKWQATIRTHGVTIDDVATLVRRIDVTTDDQGGPLPGLTDPQLGARQFRSVVADRTMASAVFGDVVAEQGLTDADGHDVVLRMAEGDLDTHVRSLLFLGARRPMQMGGRTVGALPDGRAIVMWSQGGSLLTVTGRLEPSVLSGVADRVAPATREDWARATLVESPPPPAVMATQLLGMNGENPPAWNAGVQLVQRGGVVTHEYWFTDPANTDVSETREATVPPDGGATIDRFVIDDITYVFVSVDPAAAVDHVYWSAGRWRFVDIPLQVFPGDPSGRRYGVARVDTPGTLDVEMSGVAP